MIGRGVAGSPEGEGPIAVPAVEGEGVIAGPAAEGEGTTAVPAVERTLVIATLASADGEGLTVGSLRTVLGMSARGASSAMRTSTSRRLLSLAFATTDWWFSSVRCFASRRTEVRVREPEARSSRIRGKRRQARAASMRLQAASSESRRAWVQ